MTMTIEQKKEYQRNYYIRNKERKSKYYKEKYAENPRKFIALTSAYHVNHPEVSRKAGKKWEYKNKEKLKLKNKTRYENNKEYFYDWHLKNKYGISIEDYKEIHKAQDGRCCICEEKTELVVDHDHKTGKVRGLLCQPCNRSLGFMKENVRSLENAIRYLKDNK